MAEDCAARSLSIKPEQVEGEIDGSEVEATEESENWDEVVKEKDSDSHDGIDDTCADREKDKKAEPSAGKSQYEKDKEKNVAELQDTYPHRPKHEVSNARVRRTGITGALGL